MCRWLAYAGASVFLDKLLFEPENSLIEQSLHARKGVVATNGDGFGVGWYAERCTPGIYRDVLPAWNDCNLQNLAHQIKSPLFFAHVRASTGTATSRMNCHPFSHGNWLFMHNGQVGGFEFLHRRLDLLIPDHLYSAKLGGTDSEILFLLLIKNGLADDVMGAVNATIAEVEGVMNEAGVTEAFRFTAGLTDGERIAAIRYASDDCAPTLFWSQQPDCTLVASEPLDLERAAWTWNSVPQHHVLFVKGRDTNLEKLG